MVTTTATITNYDYESEWYSELTESVSYIENRHRNVQSYWIDSEGHCTFGLYYGLQEGGSDFEAFVAPIIKEDKMFIRPAVNAFLLSSGVGFGLILVLLFNRRRRIYLQYDDSSIYHGGNNDGIIMGHNFHAHGSNHHMPKITNFNSNLTVASSTTSTWWTTLKARTLSVLQLWESYPVTVGYTTGISVYFILYDLSTGIRTPDEQPVVRTDRHWTVQLWNPQSKFGRLPRPVVPVVIDQLCCERCHHIRGHGTVPTGTDAPTRDQVRNRLQVALVVRYIGRVDRIRHQLRVLLCPDQIRGKLYVVGDVDGTAIVPLIHLPERVCTAVPVHRCVAVRSFRGVVRLSIQFMDYDDDRDRCRSAFVCCVETP